MASILPGFEYDIFISYRHNDNRSGWVTEFVNALQEELAATIKEQLTIYFDNNPHDGLLETHNVDKSLEGKLKSLICIPIISQTYCDPKSFAWLHEFVAFNKLAKEDKLGRDIKLSNGNVASRILPVKIHNIDSGDTAIIEAEIGGVLRAIEFIYQEAGVNRPLKSTDSKTDNQNKTDYRNQVNKVANAIKELISGIQHSKDLPKGESNAKKTIAKPRIKKFSLAAITILLLSLAGFGFYYFGGFGNMIAPTIDRSIAVLPFVNMSKDPDQDYFSDGMMDEVLNRLFKIGDLKVISRTSSMKFKGAKLTIKEIANQLGVANILEGSVQKAGNRLKITIQLIDASSDNHLWSETYERDLNDVFVIQSEIAQAVASELRIKLSASAESSFREIPTTSPLAYDYFLKGNESSLYNESENAIHLFSKALEEDSMFAEARYKRINIYLFRFWLKSEDKEILDEYLAFTEGDLQFLQDKFSQSPQYKRALALHLYWVNRKYDEAIKILKELVTDNPGDNDAREFVASILRRQGRWKEAIEQFEKCLKSDPLNTDFIIQLSFEYLATHQPEKAVKLLKFGRSVSHRELILLRLGVMYSLIEMGYDASKAMKESGVTSEEWANDTGIDFINKSNINHLANRRKEGKLLRSAQTSYFPITFDYARIYFLNKNPSLAKVYADSATAFLLKRQTKMTGDQRLFAALGICYALAGNEKLAIQNGKKATELLPITLDAYGGPDYEQNMAEIFIILNKYDLALDKVEMLLSIPSSLSIGRMMADPIYEPIRNLPRFKKLVEKYKYKGKG